MNINGVTVHTKEVLEVMESLENTYFPVHDANGKIIDLTNMPTKEVLLEKILENRRAKSECV